MIKRLLPLLLGSVCLLAQQTGDPLAQESRNRHERLVREGYNLTYGLSFGDQGDQAPLRAEFLVTSREAHRLSLWLKTRGGEAHVRLRGDEGTEILSWSGQEGELALVRRLAIGKYVLEITSRGTQGGCAEFAVKGPLSQVCSMDRHTSEVPALPDQGFHWPYLLHIPKERKVTYLLVVPNNTTFATENLDLIRASGTCEVQRQRALADRLGCPLLVPLFPRPILKPDDPDEGNLYLHALSRDALVTDRRGCQRVDLQLISMIEDARARLDAKGWPIQPKVLLSGFSASGMFVNRFGLLHPDRVLAVACGSPGGWPMVPVEAVPGARLSYPVGCADLATLTGRPLDRQALQKVAWFFYLGEKDTNDAVVCRDSFSKPDEDLIIGRFGATLQDRWRKAESMFMTQKLAATFRRYASAAHVVSDAMAEDLARFLEEQAGTNP